MILLLEDCTSHFSRHSKDYDTTGNLVYLSKHKFHASMFDCNRNACTTGISVSIGCMHSHRLCQYFNYEKQQSIDMHLFVNLYNDFVNKYVVLRNVVVQCLTAYS